MINELIFVKVSLLNTQHGRSAPTAPCNRPGRIQVNVLTTFRLSITKLKILNVQSVEY